MFLSQLNPFSRKHPNTFPVIVPEVSRRLKKQLPIIEAPQGQNDLPVELPQRGFVPSKPKSDPITLPGQDHFLLIGDEFVRLQPLVVADRMMGRYFSIEA